VGGPARGGPVEAVLEALAAAAAVEAVVVAEEVVVAAAARIGASNTNRSPPVRASALLNYRHGWREPPAAAGTNTRVSYGSC